MRIAFQRGSERLWQRVRDRRDPRRRARRPEHCSRGLRRSRKGLLRAGTKRRWQPVAMRPGGRRTGRRSFSPVSRGRRDSGSASSMRTGQGCASSCRHRVAESPTTGHSWAPSGTRLTVQRRIGNRRAVFVIDADGTHPRRLTPWALRGGEPDWSPGGGSGSCSTSNQDGPASVSANLYTVRPDRIGPDAADPCPGRKRAVPVSVLLPRRRLGSPPLARRARGRLGNAASSVHARRRHGSPPRHALGGVGQLNGLAEAWDGETETT